MAAMIKQQPKAIIFDIGNVVLEWQPEHILRSTFSVANMPLLLEQTFLSPEWSAYDQGLISTKDLKEQLADKLECSNTAMEALLQSVVVSLRPFPEMVELLIKLKSLGYPIYALSNMPNDIFLSLFEEHKFWELFDDIVISSHIKLIKPDPAIFEFILNKHQLKADECIFLDDSTANVVSAQDMGFTVIKVINFQQAIDDLSELLGLDD